MRHMEHSGILGEYHGAHRKGRLLEDNIFNLKWLRSMRRDDEKKTWLAFLDISKAFDTILRDQFFCNLWELGVQGKAWHLVKNRYKKVENKKWADRDIVI